jgi:hypothetical protein
MKRATVTINDDLEASLEAYTAQQDAVPALTAVVQAALREYLERRGFGVGPKALRITPAKKGSGARDASLQHDRYLAGK